MAAPAPAPAPVPVAPVGGPGVVVDRLNGFHWNKGGKGEDVFSVRVIVIQAAFGDATLLEVIDDSVKKVKSYYLIDGGPTTYPGQTAPVKVFENLIETLLQYTKNLLPGNKEEIKLGGIMITHPDGDHVQGIVKLFRKFLPNQDPAGGKVKLNFSGPLLITELFDKYKDYMKSIEDAKLKKVDAKLNFGGQLKPGDSIPGFERQFNYFYPVNKSPGSLYMYQAPGGGGGGGGGPAVPRHIYARSRYDIDTSKANATSILLVINDPNNDNGDPWISLNGDSLGHSVLQSLDGKKPKLFKVPHHGSVYNSNPLGDFKPKDSLTVARYVVIEVLLKKAIDKINDEDSQHILDDIKKEYDKIKDIPLPANLRGLDKISDALNFDNLFTNLAKDFKKELDAQGMNTKDLLDSAKKRKDQINDNIEKIKTITDIKNDIYTNGVDKPPGFFTATKYNKAKNATLATADAANIKRIREGYNLFFRFLEKDFTFAEKLAFFLTRAFYNQIHANTYFISSGSLHRHPSWEVINGIIASAHDYRSIPGPIGNPNYKCRILLTSGNNIKGQKLKELDLKKPDGTKDDWTEYVSIQYFTGTESSTVLDPQENVNGLLGPALHGTEKWDTNKTDDDLNKLKRKYNEVEGAVALRKKRAVESGDYEVKSPNNHWFELEPPAAAGGDVTFKMTNVKRELEINRIRLPIQGKTGIYERIEIIQKGPDVTFDDIYAQTTHSAYQQRLFVIEAGTNKHQYLKANPLGVVTKEDDISDGTFFVFTKLGARLAAPRQVNNESNEEDISEEEEEISQPLARRRYGGRGKKYGGKYGGKHNRPTFDIPHDDFGGKYTKPSTYNESSYTKPSSRRDDTITVGPPDDNSVIIVVEGDDSEFGKYLNELNVALNVNDLKIFDAIILLLQSDLTAYYFVDSVAQLVVGKILDLSIDTKQSKVEYVTLPTGPYVTKASIFPKLPEEDILFALGFNQALQLTKIEVVYPELYSGFNKMYLSGTGKVGNLAVNIKCHLPEVEELPEMEISLPDTVSLANVVSLLQVADNNMPNFNVPLMTALKDIHITEASVTFRQGIQSLQCLHLSRLSFGVSFTNLSSYLPSSFSSLQTINTHVVVYHPKTPPIKIALEVEFKFEIPKPRTKTTEMIPLTASFATRPVDPNRETDKGYNFTVAIQAQSTNVIGTADGGVTLINFLKAFELNTAVDAINSIPFIYSILDNVQLKRFVLEMNTKSKEINVFTLELCIYEWELLRDKITIDEAEFNMYYDEGHWQVRSRTLASFGTEYQPVEMTLELSNSSTLARLTFSNDNQELTIANFFKIFGFETLGDLPIVGKFMQTAVTEAFLEISDIKSGIRVSRAKVSLSYTSTKETDDLEFDYFRLHRVDATISVTYNENSSSYSFGFSISGFINDILYVSAEYNPNTSELSGSIEISTFKQATFFYIFNQFLPTSSIENNTIYKDKISSSPSVSAYFMLEYDDRFFDLTNLEIDIKNVITLGSFSLDRLKFEYHYIPGDFRAGILSQHLYSLLGVLSIEDTNMGVMLKIDLAKDTTAKILTASILPLEENSLSISNFMKTLGVAPPTDDSMPKIEGQQLPNFLDVSLTEGTITFSITNDNPSNFTVQAFSISVKTTNEITLLNSPLIKLREISLKIDYDKEAIPNTTSVYLIGVFSIGHVQLTLQGSKEPNGDTVFRLIAKTEEETTTELQQSIDKLTPTDTTSPVIPSDIGIPKPLNVLVAELIVKYSPSNNENSVLFTGNAQLDWPIDLRFQEFTVKEVGGKISYKKSTLIQSPPPAEYEVSITGQFQFSEDTSMSSEIHFGGENIDTVLSVIVENVTEIEIPSVADDFLGFNDPQDGDNNSVQFNRLLPQDTEPFLPNGAFININFTKKMFGLFCGLQNSLGHGFLLAGDFSTTSNTTNYGYVFGLSLPENFRFSKLFQPLDIIDNILKVKKANAMVLSINNAKVSDVVAKLKSVQQTAVSNQTFNFPFANLTLDTFTKNQILDSGLSIYCELDFPGLNESSLFQSIIRITPENSDVPNVIIHALVSQEPVNTTFKAKISNMTLLGAFQFTDINLIYKPKNKDTFELNGKVTISISDSDNFEFIGKFTCSSTRSEFTVSTDEDKIIVAPLGMVGITLRNIQLSLIYNYPTNQTNVTSSQSLSGTVNFFSSSSDVTSPTATPSVVLTGSILFNDYKPTVVKLVLETDKPLTIADLVATVFKGSYDTLNFLNIGFVSGQVYYAKLEDNVPSIVIDEVTYKRGYHIAADIEIFDKMFTVEADIVPDTKTVSVTGYAQGALDLGFAKLTGATANNQVDDTKSPQVVFSTSPNSTSISLKIGFILFGTKLGVGEIGYMRENEINKFYGKLTFGEKFNFFLDHINIEWSKEHGFKVTDWPISSEDFQLPFDFFNELKSVSDECGDLVKMAFKKAVQTDFDIHVSLSKPDNPETVLTQLDITGTFDILLGDEVKIGSIPLPPLSVSILKSDNLTLSGLPGKIQETFSHNAKNIVNQILDYPDRLVKILSVIVLKNVAPEVISTLVCRDGGDEEEFEQQLDPEENDNADDPTEDEYNEANEAEKEFDENLQEFEEGLSDAIEEGVFDAGELAGSAATAEGSADAAGGALTALGSAIAGFLAAVGFGVFVGLNKRKDDVDDRKEKIENERQENIRNKMKGILDLHQNPQPTFEAPSTLKIDWFRNDDHTIKYHVKVTGIPIDVNHIGEKTAPPVEIYNNVIDLNTYNNPNISPKITINDEKLYNMLALTVEMRGTVTGTSKPGTDDEKIFTYYGPTYTTEVPKVHPTLHPPSNLQATYNHSSRQINVTATPVNYAQQYIFQLIDNHTNLTVLGHPLTTTANGSTIQCNFPHSYIEESSIAPFKVRAQSAMEDDREHPNNTGIASSVFVTSNSLQIVPPPSNLKFTLPHFLDENQTETINLKWDLPETITGISSFTGQVFDANSNEILVTQEFTKGSLPTLPKSGTLEMNTLKTAVNSLTYTYSDILTLTIRISSTGNSQQIIDSAFISQSVVTLKSPENVTAEFSSEDNKLKISWLYSLQSSGYGITIRDNATSNVLWSRKEIIRRDPIDENKVGKIYSLEEIAILDNPKTEYSVEVIAIANGNETFDSFIPNKAPENLQVLPAPTLTSLTYLKEANFLSVVFTSLVTSTLDENNRPRNLLFTINLRKNNEQEVTFPYTLHYQSVVSISVDQFIDKFNSGDVIKCSVFGLGRGYKITGQETIYTNTLTLLLQPTNVTCTYNVESDQFEIRGTAAPGVQNYLIGFYVPENPTGYGNLITREITATGNTINYTLGAYLLRTGMKTWRFYIQSLLSSDSTTQLPSPRFHLDQDITKLETPQIESLQYSDNKLTYILAEPIENAANYNVHIYLIANDGTNIQNYTKMIPPPTESTELTVDLTEDVSDWESLLEGSYFNEIRTFMAAVGSGYTITSSYTGLHTITRLEAPSSISCQYSSSEETDVLNVKFWGAGGNPSNVKMKVVVKSVGEGSENKEIIKYLENPLLNQLNTISITGDEIREQDQNEWTIYGRMIGNNQIQSKKLTYSYNNYKILDTPHIISAAYNVNTTKMGIKWTVVDNIDSYRLLVTYETSDEEQHKTTLTAHPEGISMTFYMSTRVDNWGAVSDTSKFALILTAVGQNNGYYINSKPSADYDIDQQFTFFISSNETNLSLKWDKKYDNRNIWITSDRNLFTAVQDVKDTEIPKRVFLNPTVNSIGKPITVIVHDEETEGNYSSTQSATVQTQKILETNILGYNAEGSGQYTDGLSAGGSGFVGIKRIEINHNGESVTRIRVTYIKANGSQYPSPRRGTYSSNQITIELEDKECIIAVSASTSQSMGLSRLTFVTQKVDGTCRKYGPYGQALIIGEIPIRFSGNVISFKGRTDSGGLKNLGFFYTLITPTIKRSPEFGEAGGHSDFENHALTYVPQVSHVHSISLKYDGQSIVSIKPYYKLVDGTIAESLQQGGLGYGYNLTLYPVNVTFEEEEILIGISGKSYYYDKVPGNVISSLKLTTQKSDGTLKEYGPYGKPEDEEGGTPYIIRGKIYGFFGSAGWIIGRMGVYYSLERSEIFGVSGGLDFEDAHPTKPIARLKKLNIRYNSFYIRCIYGTYVLSDGSTWEGPKHGQTSNTYTPGVPLLSLKTIEFADDEDIISLIVGLQRASFNENLSMGYLEIVTQTGDGRRKEYPRIVKTFQYNSSMRSEREFKGRVVSLIGRSSTSDLMALGVNYIPIPDQLPLPIITDVKSSRFGSLWAGTTGFNDSHTIPSESPVARVKSIIIQYDSMSLVAITPVYEFENGQLYESPKKGGSGYSQTITTKKLEFEHGEILVGIKGYYQYDSRANSTVISQFSAITQKSDGIINTHGPYGKSDGGTSFMTWGIVNAFYGQYGSIFNQIGVYSFLYRTELIGSPNEGMRFADEHGYVMTVGIKTLKIKHSHKIHSIQATYRTSIGTTYDGELHGTDPNGTLETFEFEEDEDIVSLKIHLSGHIVGGLEFTTQKRDGTNKKIHPRVGTENEGRDVEIRGRVVSFIGRSQYYVNALGVKYIPLPPEDDD